MANVILTAKRISPSLNRDLTAPKLAMLQTEQIVRGKLFKKGTSVLYGTSTRPYKKYRMAETPAEYDAAQRLVAGLTSHLSQTLSASGIAQASAQAITAYNNIVTAAQGAASGGLLLPAAVTKFNNGGAFVVDNRSASSPVSVFPAVGEFMDSGAVNVPATAPALARIHFYASASNKWLSATVYE